MRLSHNASIKSAIKTYDDCENDADPKRSLEWLRKKIEQYITRKQQESNSKARATAIAALGAGPKGKGKGKDPPLLPAVGAGGGGGTPKVPPKAKAGPVNPPRRLHPLERLGHRQRIIPRTKMEHITATGTQTAAVRKKIAVSRTSC